MKGEFKQLLSELEEHKKETATYTIELKQIEEEVLSHGNLHVVEIDVICKLIVLLADFQKKIAD